MKVFYPDDKARIGDQIILVNRESDHNKFDEILKNKERITMILHRNKEEKEPATPHPR